MSGYPSDIEAYMIDKVVSGEFSSQGDFAAEAVRLYRELELRHELLKTDLQKAVEQSEEGSSVPLDMESIKEELRQELGENGQPN